MTAPCKNCTERKLHCHSECDKYITYNAEREKQRQDKKKRDYIEHLWFEHMKRNVRK